MTQTGSRLSVRLQLVRLCWKYLELTTHATGSPSPTQSHTHFQLCVVWLDESLVEVIILFRDVGAKEEITKSRRISPLLLTFVEYTNSVLASV